jgi:hypothetical protein
MTRPPRPTVPILTVFGAVLLAVAGGVASAGAALAQTTTSYTTNATPIAKDADPLNAGGLVFLFVSAVIFGGALILYLRHRQPRVRS